MARVHREWVICPCCQGEGKSDSLGVVDREDFSDADFESYLDGGYDTICERCGGTGKVIAHEEPIVRAGSDGQNVYYADADDASEHLLRMAEGWC